MMTDALECGGFTFFQDFDSGNLGRVEFVGEQAETDLEEHQFEFNLWTRPDNGGTPYENGNRTWFHFGVRGGKLNSLLKLNINTNKQSKMYGQGMAPVFRVLPGRPNWERIRERPTFTGNQTKFTLTFKHRLQDNDRVCTYFAFTYPFSYTDLLGFLSNVELSHMQQTRAEEDPILSKADEIYYHREVLCYSLERRRVDLITISSHHNITDEREPRFEHLFPDVTIPRAFKFEKEVIFLSARVHPGETPSSHVLNGMISFLMTRDDPVAVMLRKCFVFKIIPMLNPDGVYSGNYRTDTRGVNLNRVYLNPSPTDHPSIYGARKLLLYYHFGKEIRDPSDSSVNTANTKPVLLDNLEDGVSDLRLRPKSLSLDDSCGQENDLIESGKINSRSLPTIPPEESGLFLYIDMHGHASKKGIFMYGNHFDNVMDNVECMLLPKLISLNSQHFHFDSCNFSERIMYLKDKKDGSSREGAGRVAVLKTTGLVRSYTLECNYNTGKRVNPLAPPLRECLDKRPVPVLLTPPKYTPQIFEEVGRAILSSVLDLIAAHPNSRINNTCHRTLNNVRESLKHQVLSEMAVSSSCALSQPKSQHRSKRGENKRSRSITSSCETKMRPRTGKSHGASAVLSSKELRRGSMAHAVEVVLNKKRAGKRTDSPRMANRLEKKESRESRRLQPEQRQRRKKLRPK
ncbi:cytosolic carboxypeptidase-like protein 5-like [Nesidiocoris tenuis]|uniref:Cytosolic carboxypeptidase-like protein 5 n=1 Tax=Nesidiocoris tenuis TaxID=355587 RepID=A0ABN7AL49_9HEMI|nr:cytosolic carboxypeptidase-like protein 5-like [Nesidiocoris tenuis]